MKFVDEAKHCWRMFSVQAMTAAGAIQGGWMYVPEDMKAVIDHRIVSGVTIALLVLGIAGRLVKQDLPQEDKP